MTVLAAFRQKLRGPAAGPSFLAELRSVLQERGFRRLFATRLISQAGDGAFTAGVGAYVFFNKATFPNPGAAAAAFAVLYLPYSLIGPFAGVFIDRWSRRQILVRAALIRAVFVVVTASLVASGRLGLPLYVSVLAVLGVNRFFLSSLSAALPHVVADAGHGSHVHGRSRGPGRALCDRRRARRLGAHVAGRRRVLPARRGGRRDDAPRPARPSPGDRGRGSRRAAHGAVHGGRRPDQRGPPRLAPTTGGRRSRRHRLPPAAVRDPAAHDAPAVPELLLPHQR